ncbi:MAG TPA: hypothetical protein VFI15_10935, partial [Candidatus Limnocylindrales bacterium]|nr:hypothetical protein [Candidatus Limnocylindrales bacterium]
DDTPPAPTPAGSGGGAGAVKAEEARAMVVRSSSSAQAAKDLAKWASALKNNKTGLPLKLVIFTLEQKSMDVYDRDGAHLKGPFELNLPKGTHFDQGVFVTMPGGGSSMRIRLDPKTQRFRPYEDAAILQDIDPSKPKGAKTDAGDGAKDKDASAANQDPPPGSAVLPAPKAPKPFDLRKYVKNPSGLDELVTQYADAAEFLVVRTPPESEGGGTGKGGGPRSTGFGGELEGHGTPPNRPPWPVTMDGPKTLPIGGQGTFAATINWAAESSNTISMVTAQMGNEILYRWELFDITAQAKAQAEKEAARAQQAKDAIAALMGTQATDGGPTEMVAVRSGVVAGLTGKPGAGGQPATGGTAGKPAAKGAAAIPPPKPKAVGSPDDKSLADEILERQGSRAGTGADQNGITAGADFERDYANLWGDTKRTWSAVGQSKKESWLERRSDDVANVTAVALLPISGVITTLGATFRYANEKWSGDRQQQDIPMAKPGTYLVRVIATPRVQVTPNGEQIIRPSSVAVQTVQVVEMEKMVGDALRDPGTKLKEAQNALDAANKGGNADAIKAAQAQFDTTKLEVEGDPLELLDKKIDAKERELTATKAKWEKLNIHGPIIDVENQLDTLKKRRELYRLQEERRVSQLKSEGRSVSPPIRVNATLASELTGQGYPLLISVGNMGMAGTKHRWKVLDATSRKAEGFEGVGDTASEAIENAFEDFAKDAQYGKGIIGVQFPKALVDQLEPGSKADRRYTSAPAGWAVARGRIDDLVMTLAAIGLFVASAGTGAAILGGVVAAAKLIHRLHAGTLELDVEAISDVLAIFGAVAATAQSFAKGAQAAAGAAKVEAEGAKAVHIAGLRAQPLGNMFVLAPETAAVESNLAKASAALARAGALAQRVEWANEALGYAGLVWGNATFLMSMADIASQEATGAISHSEARRQRANAIGGAIQNNGMFIAGNAMKARQAAKAAKAASAATSAHTEPSATTTGTAD